MTDVQLHAKTTATMPETDAVAIKLPTLWINNTETWFFQAEAQFSIRGVKDELTKFYHVVAVLSAETASRVKDIIRTPDEEAPYTKLKKALLQTYEPTEHERAAAILSITSLGDSKPSEVMDRILSLLGNHEGGILLRYHFLRILPDYVRNALSLSKTNDLRALAAEADLIFQTGRDSRPTTQVFAGENEAEVDRIQRNRHAQRGGTHASAPNLCFYHARFGSKAKKCSPPCSMSGNEKAGQQ